DYYCSSYTTSGTWVF
nr:immunoglobulin light chain junction region [Macaca mulatta]